MNWHLEPNIPLNFVPFLMYIQSTTCTIQDSPLLLFLLFFVVVVRGGGHLHKIMNLFGYIQILSQYRIMFKIIQIT